MKRFLIFLFVLFSLAGARGQYYYPYDSSNYYYDEPSLIIQKDKIMGWYVSDISGNRISDYYREIRPYSQGHAAVKDKIMGWTFINLSGKRCTDYYAEIDDFHDGYALVKDKVMGWYLMNKSGKRVTDYHSTPWDFRPPTPPLRPW